MERTDSRSARSQCPDCPDGYVWTESGPTDKSCPTCGGRAYVEKLADLTLFQCKLDKSKCDHEWNNDGANPTHCIKCGQSFMAYAFMEAP